MSLVLSVLGLGLLASLSPSTIVVFILLLSTTRARINGLAFLAGWALSLTVVFAASYAAGASRTVRHGQGGTAVEVAEVLLGLALVVVGVRQWRRRHVRRPGSNHRLSARLSRLTPSSAAVVGVLKQPWALTSAAAVVLVHHHAQAFTTLVAFAVFTVVSTATVGLIFAYYERAPGEAEEQLALLRERVTRAGPPLLAVAAVVAGVAVALDGVVGLAGGS